MSIIRALTYHIPPCKGESFDYLIKQMETGSEKLEIVKKQCRTKIWTKRVVFPPLYFKTEDLPKISKLVEEAMETCGIDYAVIPLGRRDPKDVARSLPTSLSETSKVFYNIKVADINEDPEDLIPVAELIRKISERAGPEACIRFAIAYGGPPETPYFPASTSTRRGISACLRYAGDLLEKITSSKEDLDRIMFSLVRPATQEIELACSKQGFEFIGMDASLSPWMEESVAKVIEALSGTTFGMPGTFNAIHKLNSSISRLSEHLRLTGFNEVMLPLAEDNRLKELGASGMISAMDLVSTISVCVAGLDMVLLPSSVKVKELAMLFKDAIVLALRKRRPIGIRIILVDAQPFEWVELEGFTKAPVIPLSRVSSYS